MNKKVDLESRDVKDRKKSMGSKEEKYKRYLICFTNNFTEDKSTTNSTSFAEAFNTLEREETNIILVGFGLSGAEKF